MSRYKTIAETEYVHNGTKIKVELDARRGEIENVRLKVEPKQEGARAEFFQIDADKNLGQTSKAISERIEAMESKVDDRQETKEKFEKALEKALEGKTKKGWRSRFKNNE